MRRQPIAEMTIDEMHAEIDKNLRNANRNIDLAIVFMSIAALGFAIALSVAFIR